MAGQILFRTRGWFPVRKYGWFCRQPYMRWGAANVFLGIALDLIIPSRRTGESSANNLTGFVHKALSGLTAVHERANGGLTASEVLILARA